MPRSRSKTLQAFIVLLCAVVVWLVYKIPLPTQQVRIYQPPELLPIDETLPAWDGSTPYLVIDVHDDHHGHYRFQTSDAQVKPTVQHDSPVNQFQVDLHSGMFVLRQTNLFVVDSMPLVLTRTYRPWSGDVRASE